MSKTEKKEIIRYSNYIEVDRLALKAYRDKDEEMPKEEMERAVADATRVAIAELFYIMGRHYAEHDIDYSVDPPKFGYKTNLPLPPTEIILEVETQLWDTRIVMRIIEK